MPYWRQAEHPNCWSNRRILSTTATARTSDRAQVQDSPVLTGARPSRGQRRALVAPTRAYSFGRAGGQGHGGSGHVRVSVACCRAELVSTLRNHRTVVLVLNSISGDLAATGAEGGLGHRSCHVVPSGAHELVGAHAVRSPTPADPRCASTTVFTSSRLDARLRWSLSSLQGQRLY